MTLVSNSLVLINVPSNWVGVVTGAIIVIAALIDVQRRKLPDSWMAQRPVPVSSPPLAQPANLEQAVKRLTQQITERFRDAEVRVYLLMRTTGQLMDPIRQIEVSESLSTRVSETARSIAIADLNRDKTMQVAPFQPTCRSVAVVPITLEERLVGVVEVQSPSVKLFGTTELRFLEVLSAQAGQVIEDRWLLENGWVTQQVREALRNLTDEVYLSNAALADWLRLNGTINRSEALHRLLMDAIEQLSGEQHDPHSRRYRCYQILKQTYTEQKSADMIINSLGLSRRQYFYDLKYAVDAVTHYVYSQRNQPGLLNASSYELGTAAELTAR